MLGFVGSQFGLNAHDHTECEHMSASASQRSDVLEKARNRTLASNDPGWQQVKNGNRDGVAEDQATYEEVMNLGGPVSGASVNKVV